MVACAAIDCIIHAATKAGGHFLALGLVQGDEGQEAEPLVLQHETYGSFAAPTS